jgi:hypothetical protein
MARPRKQTYTLDMYLRKNRKGDIDNNADVQRNFVWNNEQINELVVTVLTDDYIPPIILGEEENSKLHIVDGGCRTAALRKFREMNYKITSSIENSLIPYKKKVTDENGVISYEDAIFDIRNQTYEKLPEELKEKFDEYQIETVIHESCDSRKISKYIKRYNNHVAMNTDQKAFTYIDRFASRIRKILDSRFFVICNYSEKDKTKGALERVIVESMMCMNHFDNWKSQPKAACKYLNDNATDDEFNAFVDNLHRLENIITEDIKGVFNKKDSFIFLTLFDRFSKLGYEDIMFAEFLQKFEMEFRNTKRNERKLLYDDIDKDTSTKGKQVITAKLNMLEKLMIEFLQIDTELNQEEDEVFIAKILNMDVESSHEDMDFYNETLDELKEKAIRVGSRLLDQENRKSLLAMVVYSFKEDLDLDEWIADYAANTNTYCIDQRQSYLHMKESFEQYCRKHRKSA